MRTDRALAAGLLFVSGACGLVYELVWSNHLAQVLGMGQYVSVGVLALIGVFFSLRLRFISSVKGEFYEQELAVSPAGVVRWRDALDNLVIRHFLDPQWLPRRVLAMPRRFFSESGH